MKWILVITALLVGMTIGIYWQKHVDKLVCISFDNITYCSPRTPTGGEF